MRKDALERREKLITVAAEMFEDEGYDVPLELIAERAGIGRGTLYRNFQDRNALVLEIMKMRINQIAEEVERNKDDMHVFFRFLAHIGLLSAKYVKGRQSVENDPSLAEQRIELKERADAVATMALERGKATGQIRDDLTLSDVYYLARMLESTVLATAVEEREAVMTRMFTILVEGIGPRQP